ncbi:MAG: hypothetical protein ACXABY_21070 [Candidatus Thorarchaeota archaeon]|jgi:hypothetical protein
MTREDFINLKHHEAMDVLKETGLFSSCDNGRGRALECVAARLIRTNFYYDPIYNKWFYDDGNRPSFWPWNSEPTKDCQCELNPHSKNRPRTFEQVMDKVGQDIQSALFPHFNLFA